MNDKSVSGFVQKNELWKKNIVKIFNEITKKKKCVCFITDVSLSSRLHFAYVCKLKNCSITTNEANKLSFCL